MTDAEGRGPDDEDLEVRDVPERGRYEIRVDGERAGLATYRLDGDRIEILHTEIDDRFEGKGYGSRLAHDTLADVRRRGLRVAPYCPFFRSYLEGHPEEQDLLVDGWR